MNNDKHRRKNKTKETSLLLALLGGRYALREVKCEASVERSEKLLEESTERNEVYPLYSSFARLPPCPTNLLKKIFDLF